MKLAIKPSDTVVHIKQQHITQRRHTKSAFSFPKTHSHTHTDSLLAHCCVKDQSPWELTSEPLRRRCYPCHPIYTSFPHILLTLSTFQTPLILLQLSDKMTRGTCSCSVTASLCTEALSWIMNMNIIMNNECRIMFLSWSCAKRDETQRLADVGQGFWFYTALWLMLACFFLSDNLRSFAVVMQHIFYMFCNLCFFVGIDVD